MAIWLQIVATAILCFSCMNMGIALAWPSSTLLLFKSSNTTLHRAMTSTEVTIFGSLPAFGALIANPVAALILDRLGRKRTTMLTGFIFVIAWSIIAATNRVEAILAAMVILGCGCAVFLVSTIYISEISQDSIRGTMTAGPDQFYGLGFLVSYFLGGALGYHGLVYACLIMAVLGVLMVAVLKESPLTLMKRGEENEAANSIAFYRRTNSSAPEVVSEMSNIRRTLNSKSEDAQSLTRINDKVVPELISKEITCWQFYKASPSTRRQFYLVLVLKVAYICQGLPVVQVYAEPMFSAAVGDVISPNLCSVILGLVVLISGIVAAYLTDVIGRRPLQIYSSIAAGVCCVVLGTQLITEVFPKWTIPMLVYAYATCHTVGAGTVPFVILAEVFLPEVKSILSMLAVEWAWICHFFFLFLFNVIIQSVGLSPVFYFFSVICFGTSIYFYFYLPETKGLPVYAIQELFTKKIHHR